MNLTFDEISLNPSAAGQLMARELAIRFSTSNPKALCEALGVKVKTQRWIPVTHGEFDPRSRVVTLNLASEKSVMEILGHELGHVIQDELGITEHSEEYCDGLSAELIRLSGQQSCKDGE
jgi:hypothetical protein